MYRYLYSYKQCPLKINLSLKIKTDEEHSDDGRQSGVNNTVGLSWG